MKENPLMKWMIRIVSILIPIVVAILYLLPKSSGITEEVSFLPKLNAFLNALTSVVLIGAFFAIKNGKRNLHERLMFSALILSVLFLLSYVIYHAIAPSTPYGGEEGMMRSLYYFILLTHIVLAIVIVPLVLITFSRALQQKFDKHKKIARITLPLWLYVTVTGVLVYIMISPYY